MVKVHVKLYNIYTAASPVPVKKSKHTVNKKYRIVQNFDGGKVRQILMNQVLQKL